MSLNPKQSERLTEILQVLGAEIDSITGASNQFVKDQIERHKQWGEDMRLSPKQWAWLEDLYGKHAKLPDPPPGDIDDEIPF